MQFLIVRQKPGESPGYMEVYGFYDCEEEVAAALVSLKKRHASFGVYRLYEPDCTAGEEEEKQCSKCHGSRMVTDGGLLIAEMATGGLVKANHPPRVYPCPKCCRELHEAVVAEYRKLTRLRRNRTSPTPPTNRRKDDNE